MAWFHMMGMPIDLGTEEPCFLAFINDITSVMTEYESLKKLKSIKMTAYRKTALPDIRGNNTGIII